MWHETIDFSVDVNFEVDKFIVAVSAFFVKINQDNESDEDKKNGQMSLSMSIAKHKRRAASA